MDAEKRKAKGAELAGVAFAAGISAVPVFGGPASVVLTYLANIPIQERTDSILNGFQRDIELLFERTAGLEPDVLHTEEFMAALFRAARSAQETASDEKRKLLRNALLNGYIKHEATGERDHFLAITARYEPGHVVILDCIRELMRGRDRLLNAATSVIADRLGDKGKGIPIYSHLQDLVNDGLVSEQADREVREEQRTDKFGRPNPRSMVRETLYHGISPRGEAFLAFVADPLAEDDVATEGAAEPRS